MYVTVPRQVINVNGGAVSDSGAGFGVDLYKLDQVAKHDLGTIVIDYGEAAKHCKSAGESMDSIPQAPAQMMSDHGSVSGAFDEMHSALYGALKNTQTRLDETADALLEATRLYMEQDEGAAQQFNHELQDHGTHEPEQKQ